MWEDGVSEGWVVWAPITSPPRQASLLPLSDRAAWGLCRLQSLLLMWKLWKAFLQNWALRSFSKEWPEVRAPRLGEGETIRNN